MQYRIFTDGITVGRCGVRNGSMVYDLALTETGFDGEEGVDWECVYSIN